MGLLAGLTAGCAGSADAPESTEEQGVACLVTDLSEGPMSFTFDRASGRLTTRVYVFDIDELSRTIRVNGNDPDGPTWYWTSTFDAEGNPLHLEHRDGTIVDWHNTYAGGVLTQVEIVPQGTGQAYVHTLVTYEHTDPNAPNLWTREESDSNLDGVVDDVWQRTIETGHAVRAEWSQAESGMTAIWTYAYDGDRLSVVERDQGFWDGADGTSDIRFTWTWDDQGELRSFAQDGTDSFDYPYIDGEPDYGETYSEGCSEILHEFPWVAHLFGPNDLMPTYRLPDTWPEGE